MRSLTLLGNIKTNIFLFQKYRQQRADMGERQGKVL